MLCIKKSYFLSIFVLFAVLFGSCIITSRDVSAIADYSGSLDYQHQSAVGICNNSNPSSSLSGHACSDYLYLLLSVSGNFNNSTQPYVQYQSTNFKFVNLADPTVLLINENVSLFLGNVGNISNLTWSVNYILTDSYPSASCPACPTCPEIPENPYDPKFDEIKQAILIIPATALVIYFFFCIYRMLLKGRE